MENSVITMSVSEIAYYLSFEYPQSFHRLFKSRTSLVPLAFRGTLIDFVKDSKQYLS